MIRSGPIRKEKVSNNLRRIHSRMHLLIKTVTKRWVRT